MKRKRDNRGFSLVELIITIAIMAVLVGILAPSMLRYVEKSRVQKDDSAMAEFTNATPVAMADMKIYDELSAVTGAGATSVEINLNQDANGVIDPGEAMIGANTLSTSMPKFAAELKATVADTYKVQSNKYKGKTYKITLTLDSSNMIVGIDGEWV